MNGQNFGEHVNPLESVERKDQGTNSPVVDSDSISYKGPVLAELIQQTPMGSGVVAVGPPDETIVHEAPLGETIFSNVPEVEAIVHEAVIGTNAGPVAALLNHEESEHFRTLWNEIQGKFVDEPRSAVQQADALVSEVIEKITRMFANEHSSLEGQWKEGNDVSTEDLRKALQHYRSFFNRLVV
jgi:hypothetical protein